MLTSYKIYCGQYCMASNWLYIMLLICLVILCFFHSVKPLKSDISNQISYVSSILWILNWSFRSCAEVAHTEEKEMLACQHFGFHLNTSNIVLNISRAVWFIVVGIFAPLPNLGSWQLLQSAEYGIFLCRMRYCHSLLIQSLEYQRHVSSSAQSFIDVHNSELVLVRDGELCKVHRTQI
jgi:hypothetical protein